MEGYTANICSTAISIRLNRKCFCTKINPEIKHGKRTSVDCDHQLILQCVLFHFVCVWLYLSVNNSAVMQDNFQNCSDNKGILQSPRTVNLYTHSSKVKFGKVKLAKINFFKQWDKNLNDEGKITKIICRYFRKSRNTRKWNYNQLQQ